MSYTIIKIDMLLYRAYFVHTINIKQIYENPTKVNNMTIFHSVEGSFVSSVSQYNSIVVTFGHNQRNVKQAKLNLSVIQQNFIIDIDKKL